MTLAAQWKERFDQIEADADGGHFIPPVMIVVCDNTDIADVFYQKISGEHVEEVPTTEGRRLVERSVYGDSDVLPEFQNEPG